MAISVDRKHSLAGRENIAWFFANRKWVRAQLAVIECAWAKRPLAAGEASIRFLLLAPKRSYKRAHDRNKLKRWLRAAISETDRFAEIESALLAKSAQILVMLRVSKPLAEVKWQAIRADMDTIAEQLMKRV